MASNRTPPPVARPDDPPASAVATEPPAQSSLFEVAPRVGSGSVVAHLPALNTAVAAIAAQKKPRPPDDDDKAGHRQRLLDKFRTFGADQLADYELLEMLLFSVFRRHDTKPIAKRLMKHFGTFSAVITAPRERLAEVEGVGERVADELKLAHAVAVRLQRDQIMGQKVLGTWAAVIDYCRAAQGFETKELFRILFLDKRNQLIADEVQQTGTVDHTPVYVREVVKRALELAASAIILVHNHPSGDPTPSRADIDMTKMIADSARPLGIIVHDHIIVGRQGHASLKALRLM